MKNIPAAPLVTRSRGAWVAWLVVTVAWAALVAADQGHQMRTWANYHFDYDKTAAEHRARQKQAHLYRQQLLAQIDAAATAAEAEVRRKPGPSAKIPELLEYEAAKAAKDARSKKVHELTRGIGNVYLGILNEEALAREIEVEAPPPRPSSNWLLALLGPPVLLALMVALVPSLISSTLRTSGGRGLIAVAVLWPLAVLVWGFIFDWSDYFQREQYLGLLILPPLLAAVGFRLWRWARGAPP